MGRQWPIIIEYDSQKPMGQQRGPIQNQLTSATAVGTSGLGFFSYSSVVDGNSRVRNFKADARPYPTSRISSFQRRSKVMLITLNLLFRSNIGAFSFHAPYISVSSCSFNFNRRLVHTIFVNFPLFLTDASAQPIFQQRISGQDFLERIADNNMAILDLST